MTEGNLREVRDRLGNFEPVAPRPPDETGSRSTNPPDSRPPTLPRGCPVRPIGKLGDVLYLLDADGQFHARLSDKMSRLFIMNCFGRRQDLLKKYWPKYRETKDGEVEVIGWRSEAAQADLIKACAEAGLWDPFDRIREVGAWRGDDGSLVVHFGDVLVTVARDGTMCEGSTGLVGRTVYPAKASVLLRPGGPAAAGTGGPADRLLKILGTWRWRRPEIDARLLLGWVMAAMLGGALKWRPMVWLTGDAGSGKSTLQDLMRSLFAGALLSASDASAAGIWSKLRHSSLPIALDELEAEADNRKADAVVGLARQAASGAVILRGSADHQGADFLLRSCFLFSSILVPPLRRADWTRMAILSLDRLLGEDVAPVIDPVEMARLGSELLARMLHGWPRLESVVETYRRALADAGHDARGCDQWGTLLGVGHIALHDGIEGVADDAAEWAEQLKVAHLDEAGDGAPDHERCLEHLISKPVSDYRNGVQRTVGWWIAQASGLYDGDTIEAQEILEGHGIKVIVKCFDSRRQVYLAVASNHQGLDRLFFGTHWASKPGTNGVWVQALRRVEGNIASAREYIGRVQVRVTLIPIEALRLAARNASPDPEGGFLT